MKQYELVHLNKGIRLSREKDLQLAQDAINEKIAEGYELQQVVCPNDQSGAMIGVFYKEKKA